jgi:predicted transcriptional regulator
MRLPQRKVTEAEMAVLRTLWERQAATTRQITEALYAQAGVSEYYTVQKLLERLEEKGCVERDRSQRAHVFRASVAREQLVGQRLCELSDSLCEGSLTPLLTSLFQLRRPTAAELDQLKQLVSELEAQQRRRRKKT